MYKNSKAFTIVELLVVIVVIGILAAISIVAYNGVQQKAFDNAVLSDLDGVESEISRYASKNSGVYGSAVNWYSGDGLNANIQFTPTKGNVIDVVASFNDYCVRIYNSSAATYKTITTSAKRGSSPTACSNLSPSSQALANVPIVENGGVVTTLAGSTDGYADGTGSAARFSTRTNVAVDGNGAVYVADYYNNRIRKVSSAGEVTTLAGSTAGYADGTGVAAKFNTPCGIAIDSNGMVYVGDGAAGNSSRIRKITPAGEVTTLAGGAAGYADSTGSAAKFGTLCSLVVGSGGMIYAADGEHNSIRKITPAGEVTTLAGHNGYGYADGTGSAVKFATPNGVAVDGSGTVYVADSNNHKIRKITPAGEVTTLAGSTAGYADGTGSAAQFNFPLRVASSLNGTIYVSDHENYRIRKITPTGEVTTLAGSTAGYADGTGSAAQFNTTWGVAVDNFGTVYVGDSNNSRIRKIQ